MRRFALLLAAVSLLSGFGWHHKVVKSPEDIDQDYVFALSTANRFLVAWQAGDTASGAALVSNNIRMKAPGFLDDYLRNGQQMRHASFEISNGKKAADGRVEFEVRLYQYQPGQFWQGKRPKPGRIVLVNSGQDWLVDELP